METFAKLWDVTPVPGNLKAERSTVDVYAAKIEPKLANTLIRKLNSCAPLVNLGHVKRIRRKNLEGAAELFIILCVATCDDRNLFVKLPDAVLKLVEEYNLQPFIATVAEHAACSREEWEEQCQLWPTSYHPNTSDLSGDPKSFQGEELKSICGFMKAAIMQSQGALKKHQPGNGAVVVDPTVGCIIAAGHDETGQWMEAVCGTQRSAQDLHVHGISEQENNFCKLQDSHAWHPLRHAIMVAIERAVENSGQNGNVAPQTDCKRSNPKRARTELMEDEEQKSCDLAQQQYLCTGFDVYVTYEPCSMCAMALVHQRVRRVFYGISNPKVGALGGLHKLHGKKGLNHHYSVFQVALTEKDIQL